MLGTISLKRKVKRAVKISFIKEKIPIFRTGKVFFYQHGRHRSVLEPRQKKKRDQYGLNQILITNLETTRWYIRDRHIVVRDQLLSSQEDIFVVE